MNKKFQAALKRENDGAPPIWFMRQAGRYHKHYQALRKKHTFTEMCLTPELASEVAFGPMQDFDFDAAILFSDILYPLDALGLGLEFTDLGPSLAWKLRPENQHQLKNWHEEWRRMEFQGEAMKLTRKKLPTDKSLIGFIGGPWTLFTYAIETSHKGNLTESKKYSDMYEKFASDKLVPFLSKNIEIQLEGGAEVVMIFDTSAGELSPAMFKELVAPSIKFLSEKWPNKIMYYSKGTQPAHFRDPVWMQMPLLGFGVDHRWNLQEAFELFPERTIQGNFDQSLLFLPTQKYRAVLDEYLAMAGKWKKDYIQRWICGLGHGILPGTPEENVKYFVQRVREVL